MDGFHYWPTRSEWLVCDMVEKPARITQLVTRWIYEGKVSTRFSLKLPMKNAPEFGPLPRADRRLFRAKILTQFKQLCDRESKDR